MFHNINVCEMIFLLLKTTSSFDGKIAKQRLSILFIANMSAAEHLKPSNLNKFSKERGF